MVAEDLQTCPVSTAAWDVLIPPPLTRHQGTSPEDLAHRPDVLCDAASAILSDLGQG